jgi:hypothetical protein
MKKLLLFVSFMSLTLLVSCSGNGPEGVAKKFLNALNNGEFEEAKKYADEKTGQMLGMLGGMMTPEQKEEIKKKKATVEIVSSEEKDGKATVKYKIITEDKATADNAEKTLELIKVGDEWKVSMDKEGKNKENGMGAPAAPQAEPAMEDTVAPPMPADSIQ